MADALLLTDLAHGSTSPITNSECAGEGSPTRLVKRVGDPSPALYHCCLNHVRLAARYAVLRYSPLCVPGVLLYSFDEEQVCRHRHILKRILQPDDGLSSG